MLAANEKTHVSVSALMRVIKKAVLGLSLSSYFLMVGCSGATPVTVPFTPKVFKQQDQLPQAKISTMAASLADPFASSETSASTLTMLAGLSDAALLGIGSTDLVSGSIKNKCGFVARSKDIAEKLAGKIESQGWAQVGQTNMFALSAADASKSFSDCRCLVNEIASAQDVVLIPTINL